MSTHTNSSNRITPKLVRDRIPEMIEADGFKASTRVLDSSEYIERLIDKIHEETKEFEIAVRDHTNPVEELADILELIHAAADYIDATIDELEQVRSRKLATHGGFKNRTMLLGKDKLEQGE
jgi:predicted house-cleaning noncanonical NTP pyrophosphatase (MazG superfamily)